jgi:hypothetical protein
MKARVSNLHKTEEEWKKYKNWTPEAGELIVYDPDSKHDYARLKVGDGKTMLSELPFFVDSAITTQLQNSRFSEVIDGGRITDHT